MKNLKTQILIISLILGALPSGRALADNNGAMSDGDAKVIVGSAAAGAVGLGLIKHEEDMYLRKPTYAFEDDIYRLRPLLLEEWKNLDNLSPAERKLAVARIETLTKNIDTLEQKLALRNAARNKIAMRYKMAGIALITPAAALFATSLLHLYGKIAHVAGEKVTAAAISTSRSIKQVAAEVNIEADKAAVVANAAK